MLSNILCFHNYVLLLNGNKQLQLILNAVTYFMFARDRFKIQASIKNGHSFPFELG